MRLLRIMSVPHRSRTAAAAPRTDAPPLHSLFTAASTASCVRHLHLPPSLLPLTTHARTHSTHQLLERRSALLALQTLLQRLQTHRLLGRVLLQVLALQLLALFLISQPHTHAHPLAQLARTLLTRPQTLLAAAQLLLLAVQTLDLVHVAAVLLHQLLRLDHLALLPLTHAHRLHVHFLRVIAHTRTPRRLHTLHRITHRRLLRLVLTRHTRPHLRTLQSVLQLQLLCQQTVLLIALAQRLARLVVQVRRLLPVQTLDLR